jgi:hypothetical protein
MWRGWEKKEKKKRFMSSRTGDARMRKMHTPVRIIGWQSVLFLFFNAFLLELAMDQ